MLAQLVIMILALSPAGPVRVFIQFPFATMAACEAYMADPTPILVHGGKAVAGQCVDKPTNPGNPI